MSYNGYMLTRDSEIKLLYEKAKDIEQQIINVDYNGNASNVNKLLEVTEKLSKAPDIRVINFPAMQMISSGPLRDMEVFEGFDSWWSAIDTTDYITPRDFLYFDNNENCMVWLFAPPRNFENSSKYKYVDFPGGLYAVCASKDGDGGI